MELVTVDKLITNCQNSHFQLVPSIADLGSSYELTNPTASQIRLSIEETSKVLLPAGAYNLEVHEIDDNTGFIAKTLVEYTVIDPPVIPDPVILDPVIPDPVIPDSVIPDPVIPDPIIIEPEPESEEQEPIPVFDPTLFEHVNITQPELELIVFEEVKDEPQAIEEIKEEEIEETEAETVTLSNEEIDNLVTVDADGKVVYPWQQVYQVRQRKNQEQIVIEEEIKPLEAYIQSITPAGNMTIAFTKPIIMPPLMIEVDEVLPETNSTESNRDLQSDYQFLIEQIVDIRVDSGFYEENSDEISLFYYNLTRLSESSMDISLNFRQPPKITQIASDPDMLIVNFLRSGMFMDKFDGEQLASELSIDFQIQPQISLTELVQLKDLCEKFATSIKSLSIFIIIPQGFFAMALKYLWNIMNLLQFLIFMLMWQIKLPMMAKITI